MKDVKTGRVQSNHISIYCLYLKGQEKSLPRRQSKKRDPGDQDEDSILAAK